MEEIEIEDLNKVSSLKGNAKAVVHNKSIEGVFLRMSKEFDNCFKYYEKAIEGRNLHYQNYNTWVNYYSIFTGAFFVCYYTFNKSGSFFTFIVTLLGFITAFAWHQAVRGHYIWMISWISIVQEYEKKLSEIQKRNKKEPWLVYDVYTHPKADFHKKNISTQKITSSFTFIVILAWSFLLIKEIGIVSLFRESKSFLEILTPVFLFKKYLFVKVVLFIGAFVFAFCNFRKESDVSAMSKSIQPEKE